MRTVLLAFLNDRRGATAIEYGLIGGLVSIAILGGVLALGGSLQATYEDVAAKVQAAVAASGDD